MAFIIGLLCFLTVLYVVKGIIGFLITFWLRSKLESKLKEAFKAQGQHSPQQQQKPSERMVKCQYCNTYIPQSTALEHNTLNFCSQEHRKLFQEEQKHE